MSNKLSDLSLAIAEMVAATAVIDPATGATSNMDELWAKGFDVTKLLTVDDAKAYHTQRDHFIAGFNHGLHQAALPVFKANPELLSVSGTAPMFDDELALKINRSSTFPVPGKDEKVTVHGASTLALTVRSVRNVGELRISRQHWRAEYSSLAD